MSSRSRASILGSLRNQGFQFFKGVLVEGSPRQEDLSVDGIFVEGFLRQSGFQLFKGIIMEGTRGIAIKTNRNP